MGPLGKMLCLAILLVLSLQLCSISISNAQNAKSRTPETSKPTIWRSPESLMRDLRSTDDNVRRKALDVVGVAPSFVSGPVEVQLRITEMGKNQTNVAIIVLDLDFTNLFAVVALEVGDHWQQIGTFNCWCKYESGDLLNGFVNLESATDDENELVVHTSGGGTGIYEQKEDRYRLRSGKLIRVLNFVRLSQECPGGVGGDNMCHLEHRVFMADAADGLSALVETKGTVDPAKTSYLAFIDRTFQLQYTGPTSCRGLRWSEKDLSYVAASLGKQDPCKRSRVED